MSVEIQILNQLIHNDQYARIVLPHLKDEYFGSVSTKAIFNYITFHTTKYGNCPSYTSLQLGLDSAKFTEEQFASANELLGELKGNNPVDPDWMVDTTEEYCKDRAMNNALRKAIDIMDDPKQSNGIIPQLMTEAQSISFDSSSGHDYFADAESRYDGSRTEAKKLPFSIESFNKATNGGIEDGTLNIIMAGCVHPDTLVVIKYEYEGVERIRSVQFRLISQLIEDEIEVYIKCPKGFVKILTYHDKGPYDEYIISIGDGRLIRCNADHLIQTHYGWITALELKSLTEFEFIYIQTDKGMQLAKCKSSGMVIPIVDITVDSEDHEYYANGIVSHNTNVGKSLLMCQWAADHLLAGKNVLYITLEMAEEKIAQRIDANLLDVSLDDFGSMPKSWYLKAIEKVKSRCTGKLKVKEYPNGSAHVGHFRHLIQEYRLKEGFVPDVIYIDYLNICACAKYATSVQRHQYVQGIAEELRSLAQELHVPFVSATQTNREGVKSSDPSMTDVGEAWGLPATVDWFIIVTQPDELVQLGQFQVKQDKSRYSDKNKMRKFIIGVDPSKQRVFDVKEQGYIAGPEVPEYVARTNFFDEN